MNYICNMQHILSKKLGPNHKYNDALNLVITDNIYDELQADLLIKTICQDPEIHALYFPVHADVDFEIKETFCRHELCRLDTPPKKHVMQAYWNSISKPH